MGRSRITFVFACALLLTAIRPCAGAGQEPAPAGASAEPTPAPEADTGAKLPNSDRLRLTVDFMSGYGSDASNAMLGFNRQGRVGYVIFAVQGRATTRLSYFVSVNPVNETEPLPACGVDGFFFPNDPKHLYGADTEVQCAPKNGNRRVDAYRGIALDVVPQQGSIREAYLELRLSDRLKARLGRTKIPIGFDWQEAGSFSAKDAPRIQRINAESSFGVMLSYERPVPGQTRPRYSGRVAAMTGEGNRWWDYNYFYFEDGSLDANVDLTMVLSGTYSPRKSLEVRAAFQKGQSGSKVERRPSYWASKRNDDATVISVEYQPVSAVRLIAEHASYTWGPTVSSAAMMQTDYGGIKKRGFYFTAEAHRALTPKVTVGGSMSREEMDRADSLVRYMVVRRRFGVETGRKDRMIALRAYLDLGRAVRVGLYKTAEENPYPWLSGVSPVKGPNAFAKANTNKWGFITRLRVM